MQRELAADSSNTLRVVALDSRHLILSSPANAGLDGVDACVAFVYPHWFQGLETVKPGIAACKAADKPFLAYEYGWDATNYATQAGLRSFLRTLEQDPRVAGDAFWALQAHQDGHGWMPIPARIENLAGGPRRQREFPGDVRFHDLRLLRRRHRPNLLSERERIRLADEVVDDLWLRLLDASARRPCTGRLCGSPGAAEGSSPRART